MALPIPPNLGCRVPDEPHAISTNLPKWQDMVDFGVGEPRIREIQQGGYPRSFLHAAVKQVHGFLVCRFGNPNEACFLFPRRDLAETCKKRICDLREPSQHSSVRIQGFRFNVAPFSEDLEHNKRDTVHLYATFMPVDALVDGMVFWRLTGCGVSSRLAESLLENISTVSLVSGNSETHNTSKNHVPAALQVRERIASLLERASFGGTRYQATSGNDIFLYQTGMAAIYHLTRTLYNWPGTKTVVFGFPYELTLKVQQDFAKGCSFYGFGTESELDLFENYLDQEAQVHRMIQAVWVECPSNPLLRTADLRRIRRLADRYGFLVIADDTIGSFANVDLLGVADVVVTSLTKSFSGFANVMAGSIAINPRSKYYQRLHIWISRSYTNDLFYADAIVLERNSRDFLPRAAAMNRNAYFLVSLLFPFFDLPNTPLAYIYYPTTCWSANNYRSLMRPETTEFTPGYGGLFTLEFKSVVAAAAFFDTIQVHKGPSLGAHVTLAQPYVQTVFAREKKWAKSYGLNEAIVRISVGIEDTEELGRTFLDGIRAAQDAWAKECQTENPVYTGHFFRIAGKLVSRLPVVAEKGENR